jgi:hypothetical protein
METKQKIKGIPRGMSAIILILAIVYVISEIFYKQWEVRNIAIIINELIGIGMIGTSIAALFLNNDERKGKSKNKDELDSSEYNRKTKLPMKLTWMILKLAVIYGVWQVAMLTLGLEGGVVKVVSEILGIALSSSLLGGIIVEYARSKQASENKNNI